MSYLPCRCIYSIVAHRFHCLCRCIPTEYLSTEAVQEQGELRRAAVERFLEAKFLVLLKSVHKALLFFLTRYAVNKQACVFTIHRYLTVIPTQNVAVFAKGAAASSISKRPISSAVDLVEITLKV